MKKALAFVLTIVLVMSLSVAVFAANDSASGEAFNQVHIINGPNVKPVVHELPVGSRIELKADESKGTFNNWAIYLLNGAVAQEGVDYKIEGKLTDKNIVIYAYTDLVITGNYNGVKTEFEVNNGEVTSPQTGDSAVVVLAAVMVLALAGAAVAKKQLVK